MARISTIREVEEGGGIEELEGKHNELVMQRDIDATLAQYVVQMQLLTAERESALEARMQRRIADLEGIVASGLEEIRNTKKSLLEFANELEERIKTRPGPGAEQIEEFKADISESVLQIRKEFQDAIAQHGLGKTEQGTQNIPNEVFAEMKHCDENLLDMAAMRELVRSLRMAGQQVHASKQIAADYDDSSTKFPSDASDVTASSGEERKVRVIGSTRVGHTAQSARPSTSTRFLAFHDGPAKGSNAPKLLHQKVNHYVAHEQSHAASEGASLRSHSNQRSYSKEGFRSPRPHQPQLQKVRSPLGSLRVTVENADQLIRDLTGSGSMQLPVHRESIVQNPCMESVPIRTSLHELSKPGSLQLPGKTASVSLHDMPKVGAMHVPVKEQSSSGDSCPSRLVQRWSSCRERSPSDQQRGVAVTLLSCPPFVQ